MKGAVASGHPLTGKAAKEMFASGGNAFDAAVSAGFASVITESPLTSLGGGGFLLVHVAKEKKNIVFDFFVNTPGLNRIKDTKPAMEAVEIKFPSSTQIFHIGLGSVAVPGMLQGLLHVHQRLCTLPLKTILSPSLQYLDDGVVINETQEVFLNYLESICTLSDYGKQVYMKNGRYIKQNDKIINPHLKNFLEGIISQDKDMYIGKITKNLVMEMHTHGGLISKNDIDAYRVIEREPLCIKYRDREIFTNPPPSFGGIMIALSLEFLRNNDISPGNQETDTFFISLIELMRHVDRFRSMQIKDWIERIPYPFEKPEISQLIQTYQETVAERLSMTTQGTTHISIIDEEGNAASMTSSNGSGSGYFIPDTGIMLNNMMGEDDLHPEGFFCAPCGKRVSSMMAPTIVMKNGKVETVMGSGGSKRIRTAMLQVLINSIDFHYPLKEAIEAPRIHWEDNRVQVEPEIPEKVLERLKKQYTMNIWKEKSVYFGGVHAVTGDMEGWGDSRRGGNCLKYS